MLTQKKTKAIMLGDTPVKRVMFRDKQIWPEEKTYNTMTIRWQETTNPEDFFLEYLDDAEGLTQGSEVFDEFFAYKPVLLNTSGVETAELNPNDFSKDINGNSVNITSGDNVMIKFPVLGVKMSKEGSTVTLSLTKELNKEGYQYYAHQNGSLSSPGEVQSAFYIGAYSAYNNSNVLKSWSGKAPTTVQTQATFCTQAKANGNGYNIIGWYQRQFVNALYMMKYGNPDSQSVIGQGYVGNGSTRQNTGATDTIGMTGATNTSNTGRIKLFGLEDWRGNISQWVGGTTTGASGQLRVVLSGYSGRTSEGENTGIVMNSATALNMRAIQGDNKGMFAPYSDASTGYYSDIYTVRQLRLATVGGGYSVNSSSAGIFYTVWTNENAGSSGDIGTRLQYLSVPAPTITPLTFTAEEANSTVALNKTGSPTVVELETSTDGNTWSDYTIGDTITLANVGDKVYMRNKSETTTRFTNSNVVGYAFAMTGKIGASGDVTSLINKNCTDTLIFDRCFQILFANCTSLTTPPELPATTLTQYCYDGMFRGCTGLTTLPELPATTLAPYCYRQMFASCSGIKLSETQTLTYQIPYRIPSAGTGTTATNAMYSMFVNTGGTFTDDPTINTTYYLRSGATNII